ncbi:MAG: hypothetical protein HZA95_02480 [Candidatus Vogelbacteria bacterium]|nr:hypothetical protein [Candidatus Vogelbacteria bacterium]
MDKAENSKFSESVIPGVEVLDGSQSFDRACFDAVPLNIRLVAEHDESGTATGWYTLTADCFTSRIGIDRELPFGVRSQKISLLRAIVADKVVPLYKDALLQVKGIADGESNFALSWDGQLSGPDAGITE